MAEAISSKIVVEKPDCRPRDFRFPDFDIDGIRFIDPTVDVIDDYESFTPEDGQGPVEVGVPSGLVAQGIGEQNRIKKGTSTFVDVVISFTGAPGAEYHEFRVSKSPDTEVEVLPPNEETG